jgi:hypothetical protein
MFMFESKWIGLLAVLGALTVEPGGPAATLRPDDLDAPAATSVADARRSAEIAEEMKGMSGGGHQGHEGHAGHAGSTYVHQDAGRAMEEGDFVYVCPMHSEVTSESPGKCPKCGMTLVKRRKP